MAEATDAGGTGTAQQGQGADAAAAGGSQQGQQGGDKSGQGAQGAGGAAAGGGAQGDASKDAAAWGDKWRETYAADDPKLLARLQRYQSPKAALDALVAAQNRISSGELKAPLGANATPEEVAAFRTQNGIPEKPEGYLEKLPDGLVIGDADKPMFESFAKGLHDLNADPKIAQYAVKWYNEFQEQQGTKLAEGDATARQTTEDELRAEWGNDYRANINHITGFLSQAPKGVADLVTNARSADGKAILNDPNVMRWFAQIAREANPVGIIVPNTGGNAGETIDSEIAKIEKVMRDDRTSYNKDEKMQGRLRDLYDARGTLKARSGA